MTELAGITRLRRGKITRQFNRYKRADGSEGRRGPYHTLQVWRDGRNHSQRVPAMAYTQAQHDVQAYQTFQRLVDRLVALGEAEAGALE